MLKCLLCSLNHAGPGQVEWNTKARNIMDFGRYNIFRLIRVIAPGSQAIQIVGEIENVCGFKRRRLFWPCRDRNQWTERQMKSPPLKSSGFN